MKNPQLESLKKKIVNLIMLQFGYCGCAEGETSVMLNTGNDGDNFIITIEDRNATDAVLEDQTTSSCGRCYAEGVPVFDAPCAEKPETRMGEPLGMYHCPDCGAMVLAGIPHPPLCELCRDKKHPAFDKPQEEKPQA